MIDAGTARVTFNERVGAANTSYGAFLNRTADLSPYQLEVLAASILIKADITTFERQIYRGDVLIGDNGTNGLTRILLSEDPSIRFFGKVDAVEANRQGLKAMAVSIFGNEVPDIGFFGDVGSLAALASLDVILGKQNQDISFDFSDTTISDPTQYIGTLTIAANIKTAGNQTYTANVINVGNANVTSSTEPNALQMISTGGSVTFRTGTTNGGVVGVGLNSTLAVLHGSAGAVTGLDGARELSYTGGIFVPPAPPAPPAPPPAEIASSNAVSAAFFTSAVNQSLDRTLSNQLGDEVVEVGEVGLLQNGTVKRLDGDASCDKAATEECLAK